MVELTESTLESVLSTAEALKVVSQFPNIWISTDWIK